MLESKSQGPLRGVKIIELAGIGPSPFACMMLADAGAQILRLEKVPDSAPEWAAGGVERTAYWDLLNRSRPSVGIDLKHPGAVELVLGLTEQSNGLIEGYRPGVAERLGLGPEACWQRNRALVYGRMTGWGQEGPMAQAAGHDIDYIGIAGALWSMGRSDSPPVPPLNLVGDFGGGGLLLAFGMLAALWEAAQSGEGQVVDTSMVDGAATLMTMMYSLHAFGIWNENRGTNILDTGAPFYEVYETADGKFFAVGAIETKFYSELLHGLGLSGNSDLPDQMNRAEWPNMKKKFSAIFRSKTRDEWTNVFDGTDACAVPVLSPWEAHAHPQNVARSTFVEVDGIVQPAPSPRFSRTPSKVSRPPSPPGADTMTALIDWGVDEGVISGLVESGALSAKAP
jgi:alpha-methylacyl-CoA racemase